MSSCVAIPQEGGGSENAKPSGGTEELEGAVPEAHGACYCLQHQTVLQ